MVARRDRNGYSRRNRRAGGYLGHAKKPQARALLTATVVAALLGGCEGEGSMLDPAGPAARRIEGLWWFLFWVSVVVLVVVLVLLAAAIVRGRNRQDDIVKRPVPWGEPFIVMAGVVIPSFILVAAFLVSLRDMNALSAPDAPDALTIEVVAHDWWWEVRYPESGAVTANEIHIPVGEPVRIELTTNDVIHSFWVPRLHAKVDTVNGRVNEIWLEADEPGRYRGQCAEFCGLQHANMLFYVVAEHGAEFQAWLANEARDAPAPTAASERRGQEVFLTSTCVGCHAIRGTEATAQVGPDLTHVAGRETFASGILPMTRGNIAAWILDPQGLKEGAIMPPTELEADELGALLDYLESLE